MVEASSDSIRGLLYQHYKAVILGRMDRCMVPVDKLFVGRSGWNGEICKDLSLIEVFFSREASYISG